MQTLVVANPKGGSGKTTLATNAAGWLAGRKQRVVLADFDPLRAATEWLARRPPLFPAIGGWTPDGAKRELKGEPPQWLVMFLYSLCRGFRELVNCGEASFLLEKGER